MAGCDNAHVPARVSGVLGVCVRLLDAHRGRLKIDRVVRARHKRVRVLINVRGEIGENAPLGRVHRVRLKRARVACAVSRREPALRCVGGVSGARVKEKACVHLEMRSVSNVV